MPGIFKKLNASDVKITSFEAHKQYNTVNLPSIGATTSSLAWSGENKFNFSTGSKKYYQLDKLYYRNYIRERAHRLELDDATYTTQERRLYESASVLSLSQKTFGSEVQPNSFQISGSKGNLRFNFKDDGFGNLYDINVGKDDFPNEDNRVFYLAPVNGFKRSDRYVRELDPETGNEYVNNPYLFTQSLADGELFNPPNQHGYNATVFDDSYFQNVVTYRRVRFTTSSKSEQIASSIIFRDNDFHEDSRIIVENRPYLNFNDEDFAISFFYEANGKMFIYSNSARPRAYVLTKEGAQTSTPLGSQVGGNNSLNTPGALDLTTTPSSNTYPYRVYVERPTNQTLEIYLERFDGEVTSLVSGSLFTAADDATGFRHILLQKSGSKLQVYKNGILESEEDDNTTKPCQNQSNVVIFDQQRSDGSYYDGPDTWGEAFRPTQFQIWNQSMSTNQIASISQSITGTYPVGNIFYDNGFAAITHPKWMDVFDGGTLDTLSYKNTHLITENEYQCTMNENEFEFTSNISARKIPFSQDTDIANFATGSNFKPYITTIGLHDDNGELLVVGKLSQPVRASSETNTTFIIRYDT